MREWISGKDHITTDSVTDLILKHFDEIKDREKLRKMVEGAVGLTGATAYEQGHKDGQATRPSFDALKQAHADSFMAGWEAAEDARETAGWE